MLVIGNAPIRSDQKFGQSNLFRYLTSEEPKQHNVVQREQLEMQTSPAKFNLGGERTAHDLKVRELTVLTCFVRAPMRSIAGRWFVLRADDLDEPILSEAGDLQIFFSADLSGGLIGEIT